MGKGFLFSDCQVELQVLDILLECLYSLWCHSADGFGIIILEFPLYFNITCLLQLVYLDAQVSVRCICSKKPSELKPIFVTHYFRRFYPSNPAM